MSTMAETTLKSRRVRRQFDEDFKAQAVRLVLDEGKTVPTVARDLDLTETALREWVHRARVVPNDGEFDPGLPSYSPRPPASPAPPFAPALGPAGLGSEGEGELNSGASPSNGDRLRRDMETFSPGRLPALAA